MTTDTTERVCRLVAHDLGIIQAEVKPTARLQEELGADHIDMVTIAMSIEETFGIVLTDEQMDAIVTVEDAVRLVEAARAPAAA